MKFGVVEIGSTNTKAYIYHDGELISKGSKYIALKTNYERENRLCDDDVDVLFSFIREIKMETADIFAYGTSIFRKMPKNECNEFADRLKDELNVEFKVVTADDEANYTVQGVIAGIKKDCGFDKKLAVVIGGGGSTEIAITNGNEITKRVNLDFGAMDITKKFPELKGDVVETRFDVVLEYTKNLVGKLNESADVLVLAGGNYIYYYENVPYKMEKNFLYADKNQPYLLDFETLNNYDMDILKKSLDEIKGRMIGNESWWDGARGMRFCMNAVARELGVRYIIPTRINMIFGIINEIKSRKER